MQRLLIAGLAAIAALAAGTMVPEKASAGGPAVPYATDDIEVDQFYDALSPYGDWVADLRFGYVWYPRAQAVDWRPYTVGNWVYTDEYGWYWNSPEPFAWAVYHYGRWGYNPGHGWFWVPGDTWSPAWVQWRYSDDYVGWAPEAPAALARYDDYGPSYGGYGSSHLGLGFSAGGFGLSFSRYEYRTPYRWRRARPYYRPAAWTFVRPRHLVRPAVRRYAAPRTTIAFVFNSTRYVRRPVYRNGYVRNVGIPRAHWSRLTHRRLDVHRIHRAGYRGRPSLARTKVYGRGGPRNIYAYAPRVKKGVVPRRAPRKVAFKPPRRNVAVARASAKGRYRSVLALPRHRGPVVEKYASSGGMPLTRTSLVRPHTLGTPSRSAQANRSRGTVKARHGKAPAVKARTHRRQASLNSKRYSGPRVGTGQRPNPQAHKPHGKKPQAAKGQHKKPEAKTFQAKNLGAKKPEAKKPEAKKPQVTKFPTKKVQAKGPAAKKPEAKKPQALKPQAKKPQIRTIPAKKPQIKAIQAKKPRTKSIPAKKPQTKSIPAKKPELKKPYVSTARVRKPVAKKPPVRTARARPSGPPRSARSRPSRPQPVAARRGGPSPAQAAQRSRSQAARKGPAKKCKGSPAVCRRRG